MPDIKPALNEKQAEVAAFVEQQFWQHGAIPTNELISQFCDIGIPTLQRYWNNSAFREVLIRRGVDLRPERSKGVLTPKQLLVVNMLLNQHDRRSIREKLEACDVKSQQYYAWMKQPAFKQYIAARAEDLFSSSDHEAYLSLLDIVRGGDVQGLKLFFEMRGKYTPRAQLDMNVETVIVKIVEIVARHVTNPQVLEAIANDIDLAIGIKQPVAALPGPPEPPSNHPNHPSGGGNGNGLSVVTPEGGIDI